MTRRRAIYSALAAGALALLWRVRAIQVPLFLAAAGIRRAQRSSPFSPAQRAGEWATARFPILPAAPPSSCASVTYHPDYHAFDPQRVIASLAAARQLGVGWVRTDIRWNYIVPDGTHADINAVTWYRNFLEAIQRCQLKTIIVLSTPPEGVLRKPASGRAESWSRFVDLAARELGPRCDIFQLMNEVNNPVYRFLPIQETAAALVKGAKIIRGYAPEAKIAVNISMDLWGWENYLERILGLSGRAVDIVGLDHYPGTWTIGLHERWSRIMDLARVIASAPAGSPWYGRRLAIMETGFSTNVIGRGQIDQAHYFEGITKVVRELKGTNMGAPPLLGIYELCDENTQSWLDPEAHFGLLTSDLRPKVAFGTVARALESLWGVTIADSKPCQRTKLLYSSTLQL